MDFDYESPSAGQVYLTGDFNNWDFHSLPMKKDKGGLWRLTLRLKPGVYQYRFIVDGDWQNDPFACGYHPNEFGSSNCILEVRVDSQKQRASLRPLAPLT